MRYRQPTESTDTDAYFEYPASFPRIMRPLEEEIWSELRLLGAHGVALRLLRRRLPTRRQGPLDRLATQTASCMRQAEEYFWLAQEAPPRLAPLLHYYSMFNLAKALIYLDSPERLEHRDDLAHGLSDPHRMKDPDRFSLPSEVVRVARRGIFPSLFALLTGDELAPRVQYRLADLLKYCTWIGHELAEVVGVHSRLVSGQFRTAVDWKSRRAWVTAEIARADVLAHCGTISQFSIDAPAFFRLFQRVAGPAETLRFESALVGFADRRWARRAFTSLRQRLRELRLYRHLLVSESSEVGEYLVPLQVAGAQPLPEPCVLYAITFYLGSLVRYQPHVYEAMLGSEEAWLVEAFIRQCPTCFAHIMLNHLWRVEHVFSRP